MFSCWVLMAEKPALAVKRLSPFCLELCVDFRPQALRQLPAGTPGRWHGDPAGVLRMEWRVLGSPHQSGFRRCLRSPGRRQASGSGPVRRLGNGQVGLEGHSGLYGAGGRLVPEPGWNPALRRPPAPPRRGDSPRSTRGTRVRARPAPGVRCVLSISCVPGPVRGTVA